MARGDQIYVLREFINLDGIYQHHGIDCGDGTVIHYRKPQATVERTSLALFSQGKPLSMKTYRVCYIPDVVVHRAEKRLGEQQYNLLFNNCEHFATWCKTGVNESLQVKNFLPLLTQININTLSEPVREALKGVDDDESARLLHQALTEIKTAWDTIQPQYVRAVQETKEWDQVARKALQNKREDLARRAIQYKLTHQKRAQELEPQLSKLAQMTETLVRKRPDWLTIQTL